MVDRDLELEFVVSARGRRIKKNTGNGLVKGLVELNIFAIEKGLVDGEMLTDSLSDVLFGSNGKKSKMRKREVK